MGEKIKVLIVDDAAFMRKAIADVLSHDPELEVVGTARNGLEGLSAIKALRPDVITLDIDMPVMDGLTGIRHIMIESPVPIVVLSSLFTDGAITFDALRLGVVDFIPKPSGAVSTDIEKSQRQLIDRIKIASSVNLDNIRRVRLLNFDINERLSARYIYQQLDYLLTLGTTLSGPNTVIRLLSNLPPRLPAAVVVVQEISPKIITTFAEQFDASVPWRVRVAEDDMLIEQGTCYLSSYENAFRIQATADGASGAPPIALGLAARPAWLMCAKTIEPQPCTASVSCCSNTSNPTSLRAFGRNSSNSARISASAPRVSFRSSPKRSMPATGFTSQI